MADRPHLQGPAISGNDNGQERNLLAVDRVTSPSEPATWGYRSAHNVTVRTLYCSQVQLVKHDASHLDVLPLPCNSWGCDWCARRRRLQLIALALSGSPNKLLTLTVNPARLASPLERRDALHRAWRLLTKRIQRQFQMEPSKRWQHEALHRTRKQQYITEKITAKTPAKQYTAVAYMAFLEKTKIGEPHLHILLRSPYIPQDWLSATMKELADAPIVDIRDISGAKATASYVTKYVTKAPAQFGNRKRYWYSKNYEIGKADRVEQKRHTRGEVEVRRESWRETEKIANYMGKPWTRLDDGWYRIWHTWEHFHEHNQSASRFAAAQGEGGVPPPAPPAVAEASG